MRSASEIIKDIREVPTDPAKTLNSRRGQVIEIRGDAIVFPLEEHTTNPEFIKAIRAAQKEIYEIIERDLNLVGKTWADKESRHRDKHYKKQKKLHLAFLGTTPPSGLEEYTERKDLQTPEKIKNAEQLLFQLINQDQIISGNIKECKLNPDGHIVVRITIDPAEKLINCKEELTKIFGLIYNRHADPEKQKTLAAVIGVVDFKKLSTSARQALEFTIVNLEKKLKLIPSIPLKSIEWIDYRKRTLSENSRLNVRTFTRREEVSLLLIQFLVLGGGVVFSALKKDSPVYNPKPKYSADRTVIRKPYATTSRAFITMFSPKAAMTRKAAILAQRIIRGFRGGL